MHYRVSSGSLIPVDEARMPDLLNQRSNWILFTVAGWADLPE
ncbi:hypothetical protein [Endozoicomonas sp. 2B-B]